MLKAVFCSRDAPIRGPAAEMPHCIDSYVVSTLVFSEISLLGEKNQKLYVPSSAVCARPVAPRGCPLEINPPLGFTIHPGEVLFVFEPAA